MKKKFRLEDYIGAYAMHCDTKEKARIFCKFLHDNNKQWCDGSSYLDGTEWNTFYEDTCYDFNDGTYNKESSFENINYIEDINYIILEFDDFNWETRENKMFTKKDLKNGDIVVKRNKSVEIVCLETGTLVTRGGCNLLDDMKDNLTNATNVLFDIMKVYRPTKPGHCQFKESAYKRGELVFDREVDENKHFIYPNGKTAKENHIDMWSWLADHPDKHKRDWFKEFWDEEWERPQGDCFACDACNCDCSICPLGEDNIGCAGGLFCTWAFYPDGYERATYAHQIANLEWNEK